MMDGYLEFWVQLSGLEVEVGGGRGGGGGGGRK